DDESDKPDKPHKRHKPPISPGRAACLIDRGKQTATVCVGANHSVAVAQTATMPKKKAAPSYFPLMTLMTPSKMRHTQ
ncbi:MAG: hypothetical protein DMG58_26515, partial [Acidobacteria bacterium]